MYNVYIHSCVYVSDQWLIYIHCLMFTCLHTNMCTYAHIIIYSYRYIYYVLHTCHPPPQPTLPHAAYGWVLIKVMSSWWLYMSGYHLLRISRGQWRLLLVVMSYTLCVVCIIVHVCNCTVYICTCIVWTKYCISGLQQIQNRSFCDVHCCVIYTYLYIWPYSGVLCNTQLVLLIYYCFCETKSLSTPSTGFEPMTPRLKVWCSNHWANWAAMDSRSLHTPYIHMYVCVGILQRVNYYQNTWRALK